MNKAKLQILLLTWILLIFQLSSTSGILILDASTWFNQAVYKEGLTLDDMLHKGSMFYEGYLENKTVNDLSLEFFIRKMAHIICYSILSVLFFINFGKRKTAFFLAIICTGIVAFMDEMNQFFMLGRSGRLADVILDMAAGTILLIAIIIWRKFKKRHKVRTDNMKLKQKEKIK